jgi:hypothetical protein
MVLAVKEYPMRFRLPGERPLSFAVDLPDQIDRATVRKLIQEKLKATFSEVSNERQS